MHQVDGGPVLLEQVGGPVVTVRRFQGHLWAFACFGHGQGELDRVVQHLFLAEHFARVVYAHDHRAPAVQVDTDVLLARYLFLHRGFPPLS